MKTDRATRAQPGAKIDSNESYHRLPAAQEALAQEALAQDALAQDALAQDALAQDALAQDALAQDALAQDALAQDALAQDALAQDALAQDALAQDAPTSTQESRAILRSRARALARAPQQTATAQQFLEIVEFRLASETYGLEAAFVREVYPLKDFTPLPSVPPFVLGILNVRGQILSVIDLKKFFGLPEKGLGQLNKLIILRDRAHGIWSDGR